MYTYVHHIDLYTRRNEPNCFGILKFAQGWENKRDNPLSIL